MGPGRVEGTHRGCSAFINAVGGGRRGGECCRSLAVAGIAQRAKGEEGTDGRGPGFRERREAPVGGAQAAVGRGGRRPARPGGGRELGRGWARKREMGCGGEEFGLIPFSFSRFLDLNLETILEKDFCGEIWWRYLDDNRREIFWNIWGFYENFVELILTHTKQTITVFRELILNCGGD